MNSERKHDWAFLAFCSDIITDMWCRTILLNTVYINSAVWLTNFLFDTSHRQSFIFWSNTLGHPSRNQEVFAKDYLLTYLLTYLACLNWSSANANGVSSLINTDSPVLQHTYSVNAAACLVSDTSKFDRGLTQLMHVDLQCLDVPERVKFKLMSMVHNCLHIRLPGRPTWWAAAFPSLVWPVDGIFVLLSASSPRCTATQPQLVRASGFRCCWPAAWNSLSDDLRELALTVSDVCLRLICSQSTSTYSALEVSHFMRYTNLRLTYLLTWQFSFRQLQEGVPTGLNFKACSVLLSQAYYHQWRSQKFSTLLAHAHNFLVWATRYKSV